MQKEIKNEWVYEQPANEVWGYLTQPELIALWLMPNDFKPVLGHEFQFRVKPMLNMGLDGIFDCKVLEIISFQKLVYSWKGGPGNGITTLDTVVEWTLEKYGNGTKLFLKQSGFKEDNLTIFTAMMNGWEQNIKKMINYLSAGNNGSTKV